MSSIAAALIEIIHRAVRKAGYSSEVPLFIIGLPVRTGSSPVPSSPIAGEARVITLFSEYPVNLGVCKSSSLARET